MKQLKDAINHQHQKYGICCDCIFFDLCTEYKKDHCEEYINYFQKVLDLSAKGLIKNVDDHDLS
ncbi:MAG: hypothetical protein E7193_01820 [Erysipelotrichaceae bacterium]|nr:hypothetical protein [Erysipelotrichaceae bacterium]